jgi:hypothetical protein
VGDGVRGVDVDGDARIGQKGRGGVPLPPL